jgi:hypothetical protein
VCAGVRVQVCVCRCVCVQVCVCVPGVCVPGVHVPCVCVPGVCVCAGGCRRGAGGPKLQQTSFKSNEYLVEW